MDRNKLVEIFKEQTAGRNYGKGLKILENDLVSSCSVEKSDDIVCITGEVISESLFSTYNVKIEMDVKNREVISTYCSCKDYEKNEFNKDNYCCKHVAALFSSSIGEVLKEFDSSIQYKGGESKELKCGEDTLSMLLDGEDNRQEIKIEVYVERNQWNNSISAQFKIGLLSMCSKELYVLKDIYQFLTAVKGRISVNYGKKFVFDMKRCMFSIKDKALLDFIRMLDDIYSSNTYRSKIRKSNIEGKYINIPDYLVREFFYTVRYHRVYLDEGFLYRTVETEIILENPPVKFQISKRKEAYELQVPDGMPLPLSSRNNVFLYGTMVYLPEIEYCENIKPYLSVFLGLNRIDFPIQQEDRILRRLIPRLKQISLNLDISGDIRKKIVDEKCIPRFYFDMQGKKVELGVNVKYGSCEFNIFGDCREKVVYRDLKKENQILVLLKNLGLERKSDKFYFIGGDEYIFRFFKSDVLKLQKAGEVFYSENFKGIKYLDKSSIAVDIKSGKYDYLEVAFKIGDIPKEETKNILRAFRDKLKYYKLKDGQYLDLENMEIKKLLKFIDTVAPKDLDGGDFKVNKNKSIYMEQYIEDNKMRYVSGIDALKEIRDKLMEVKDMNFAVPKELKASLRSYQLVGYNWFKTLDYLGFGGILGDEMGLGKTIQTVAFLLSNKNSSSLVVVPTSLVYNWLSEFNKFAPVMKVSAAVGSKSERMKVIRGSLKLNVVVTTYNLLRRDIELYSDIQFDYCIIDEAQYIKNSHSKNAESVKKINACRKFALTGTPVENSVMEIWSIFDFIMPGYLYDEKRFTVRYYKRFKEEPFVIEDLNRLVKPFILRRKKKDVLKELPAKIERTILLEMDKNQKKVYKAYAKYALELIQHKVRDSEFRNSKIEILSYITKLRQICIDPSIVMKDYDGDSIKMEALSEFLLQAVDEGHRILVFSQFTSVLKNIEGRLDSINIRYEYLDGSVSSKDRIELVDKFNSGNSPVFLISLKAGGTGLNLTSADIVVHFDPWWNPAVESQAEDRAHRIGQKHAVEVVKLIARGTIEEKIIKLQDEKKRLIDNLIGDGLSGNSGITSMSEEDIINLFK